MTKKIPLLPAVAVTVAVASINIANACSVPVFRYALERWAPDPYRVIVFRDKELTEAEKEAIDKIAKATETEYGPPAVVSADVNVKEEIPEYAKELWEAQKDKPLPNMIVLFPSYYEIEEPLHAAPPSVASADSLLQSPTRHEIARRLIDGETAVWVFFESNDAKKNEAALKVINDTLKTAQEEMKLPHELDEEDTEYDTEMSEGVELKLAFSVLTVKADDKNEDFLRSMVQAFDEKIAERTEPLVVPVFGRARALVSYLGEEITEENILDACYFLVGPCSCQVKGMNPGLDLLIPVDWDQLITGMIGVDEALPPLTVPTAAAPPDAPDGPTDDVEPVADAEAATPDTAAGQAESAVSMQRNLRLVFILGIVFVLGATAVVAGRSN